MKKIVSILIVLLLCLSMGGCIEGCDLFGSIEFSATELSANVGDTIEIDRYITSSTSDYTLTSSDPLVVVVVNNATIKLMGEGTSTITATAGYSSAQIQIHSEFAAAKTLTIGANNDLIQEQGNTKPITFFAIFNEGAKSVPAYKWYINDVKQSQIDNNLTLPAQTEHGKYKIKVEAGNLIAEETLVVVAPQSNTVLNATALTASIKQNVIYTISNTQGTSRVEWYVNGTLKNTYIGLTPEFLFAPQYAGNYKITAKINGEFAKTENEEEFIELDVAGQVYPYNLSIDYYSSYPKIMLSWQNRDDLEIDLDLKIGTITKKVSVNIADGQVDLSGHVDVIDSFTIGTSKETVEFTALDSTAKEYLAKQFVGGRLYLRSQDDLSALFQYMVIFRPNKTANGDETTSKISFYMGYDSPIPADKLVTSLSRSLSMTGSYRWQLSGTLVKGTVNDIQIKYYTVNEPTDFSTTTPQLNQFVMPTSFSKTGRTTPLPVENFPLSPVKIYSTDELFFTLEKGLKPDVNISSEASTAYTWAKEALKAITDENMTDDEIAEAVYDYVMFCTTYDNTAAETTVIAEAVKKSAYYLEGVYKTGFAVCDGISKAVSLLCNMAGVQSVRVTGMVLQGQNWYNHAWNKVNIGGKWYVADATWGVSDRSIVGKAFKTGTKGWFLLGESDFYLNRYETGAYYPKTETFAFNYFAKKGLYLFDTDTLDDQLSALNDYVNENYTKTYTIRGTEYTADYFTVEIAYSPTLESTISNKLYSAIDKNRNLYSTNKAIIMAFK